MATLNLKFGDLFEVEADAVGHGTNTHGLMGAGIAVLFRKRHPEMYERYNELCKIFGDELGGHAYIYLSDNQAPNYNYVANIFSQKAPGANAKVDLFVNGVKDAFKQLWAENEIEAPHLAIPLIGCGIGGLEWETDVYPALLELTANLPEDWTITVVSNEPRDGFEA